MSIIKIGDRAIFSIYSNVDYNDLQIITVYNEFSSRIGETLITYSSDSILPDVTI